MTLHISYVITRQKTFRSLPTPVSHFMHRTIPCPVPTLLPKEPKDDARSTPECNQAHVRHDWRHEPTLQRPRRDKFGEPVAPDVLVHGDGNKDRAGDGLVAVDGVGGSHGWECRDLDSCAAEPDYDNGLEY